MMDPDDLVREIFVDQSFADKILNTELTEEQVDVQIRNRVATARLGWQPRLFNPDLRKWLHRISVPTHVIWGDTDKIVDPVYAAEFGRIIAGSYAHHSPRADGRSGMAVACCTMGPSAPSVQLDSQYCRRMNLL